MSDELAIRRTAILNVLRSGKTPAAAAPGREALLGLGVEVCSSDISITGDWQALWSCPSAPACAEELPPPYSPGNPGGSQ
jgi:hypothetical protein